VTKKRGPMLWWMFSAIFSSFRQKNRRFSLKNIMINFLHNLIVLWVKNNSFRRTHFYNHSIGPWRMSCCYIHHLACQGKSIFVQHLFI
jgi:hypothetical protein